MFILVRLSLGERATMEIWVTKTDDCLHVLLPSLDKPINLGVWEILEEVIDDRKQHLLSVCVSADKNLALD